jgi:hypothetical protein
VRRFQIGPHHETSVHGHDQGRRGDPEVHARLHHVIDTPGWISADLHVHSAAVGDVPVARLDAAGCARK